MSIAHHHAELLSLLEPSGPFLSLKVLVESFPQGLDAHNPQHFERLRLAYNEWQVSQEGYHPDSAIHRAWVEFVLKETLEFNDEVLVSGQKIPESIKAYFAEHGETLRPDWMLVNPSGVENEGKPRLLIQIFPLEQDLEKRLTGSRWSASPATRMMELLHSNNVRLGLLTNGRFWMLVNAPKGETTGFVSWDSDLWLQEKVTLQAFRSLLGLQRFFGVGDSATLESLLAQSAEDQHEVTTQLGYQVRKAVEVLVQKFDKIDKDYKSDKNSNFKLTNINEKTLYQAALTVMMRLVFLFSAEEQGLLLLGDTLFDNYYAVSTLRAKLREIADQYGEVILVYRSDAWVRLLATFRAVHSGVEHDSFRLPAYGGHLFDPDRFPFLEGRSEESSWLETEARPLPVDNRTVLHLLEALQILKVQLPGGGSEPRRLSFRALDVEQIGHVYEGLLDHTAVRATSPVLGLEGTKDKEPEVLLEKLEQLKAKGENDLLEFLKDETGKSSSALKKLLTLTISPQDERKFIVACDSDQDLWSRIQPFAGLVRKDTMGYPTVINSGSVYVTEGQDRRSSGTHYTPRSLTEPIVQYTLEPLVYIGVAEGKPKEEWQLKPASELLKLKVCDFAMGSGAFLVQVCRYLAERLVEAWEEAERANPGQLVVTPEGTLSEGLVEESLIPKDPTERMLTAKRIVADRCIYGVDINPMAVEMAKLSLWLVTMQKNRPFTFLDHSLKCGDSLLGVTDAKQIEYFSLQPENKAQRQDVEELCKPLLETAIAKRKELGSFTANDIQAIQRKEQLFLEAEKALDKIRFLGDLLVGEALRNTSKSNDMTAAELKDVFAEATHTLSDVSHPYHNIKVQSLRDKAKRLLDKRKPFHWLLEFPEIFWQENGNCGFDAVVGNPPFLSGKDITGILGTDYREYLVEQIANGKRGSADLSAYFFLRGKKVLSNHGGFGLLATNTIAQGDTREVGLDQLIASGCSIPRAVPSRKWPGTASLEVAYVWLRKDTWKNEFVLDDKSVSGITPFLKVPSKALDNSYRLKANENKSFQGSIVLGMGFTLTVEEAQLLIDKNHKNKDVLFPYLNGEDLNSRPDQSPSRWVINFFDWPLDSGTAPEGYKGKVAASYPDCLEIIETKVKPERSRINEKGEYILRKPLPQKWWMYGEKRPALYSTIAKLSKTLVAVRHTKYWSISFFSTNIVFSDALVVFTLNEYSDFAILKSSIHEVWARKYSGSLETRLRYSPSDCFETFPFPNVSTRLNEIGEKYNSYRNETMTSYQEGLTDIYNRFHNRNEISADIVKLRELHVEIDNAVAATYGWTDLDLGYGFHETTQGMRYTICEEARREVLDRLLELNHQRYAEEVAAGLHDTGKGKKKGTVTANKGKKTKVEEEEEVQGSLF